MVGEPDTLPVRSRQPVFPIEDGGGVIVSAGAEWLELAGLCVLVAHPDGGILLDLR
jgi:hypothetical protein